MLDREARILLAPCWDRCAVVLVRSGVSPDVLTIGGLALALAAAGAAALRAWPWALALWLASRVLDGLDGPVARQAGIASDRGGWLDLVSDVGAYGATVVGIAIGAPEARVACLVLLFTYYVNIAAFLAQSAALERRRGERPDDRSFHFSPGIAEGVETITVHSLMFAFPALITPLAWGYAVVVGLTVVQRSRATWRTLDVRT
jgi:phosphatidylglycerophosphate synthase